MTLLQIKRRKSLKYEGENDLNDGCVQCVTNKIKSIFSPKKFLAVASSVEYTAGKKVSTKIRSLQNLATLYKT